MSFNTYQESTKETATYAGGQEALYYLGLGLTGEAGEVANKIKKVMRDFDGRLNKATVEAIADELGDVLWYCSRLADELGYKLEDIATLNIQKTYSRKQRGVIQGSGDNR
jgi:NTP pyrophosphatase (non-canonical NTP hydrolase)